MLRQARHTTIRSKTSNTNHYVVRIKGSTDSIDKLKERVSVDPNHKRILIPISVGSLDFLNGKFASYMLHIAQEFPGITPILFIFAGGQRWSKYIKFPMPGADPSIAYRDESLYQGSEWSKSSTPDLEHTFHKILEDGTIVRNYETIFDADIGPFPNSKSLDAFAERNAFYRSLYSTDPEFKQKVDSDVSKYHSRRIKEKRGSPSSSSGELDADLAVESETNAKALCLEYILEELAEYHLIYEHYRQQGIEISGCAYPGGILNSLDWTRRHCFIPFLAEEPSSNFPLEPLNIAITPKVSKQTDSSNPGTSPPGAGMFTIPARGVPYLPGASAAANPPDDFAAFLSLQAKQNEEARQREATKNAEAYLNYLNSRVKATTADRAAVIDVSAYIQPVLVKNLGLQ